MKAVLIERTFRTTEYTVACILYHRMATGTSAPLETIDNRTFNVILTIRFSLRQMDLELMRRLHKKVNIVLVIGKADSLTTTEIRKLKQNIQQDLEANNIQLYQFPDCDSDEDEDFKQQDRELKASIPFAVVGSNVIIEVAGKKVRGRQYPWGVVDGRRFIFPCSPQFIVFYVIFFAVLIAVENPKHSDFIKLRTMLVSTHMQDLKDTTQDVHYENFRAQCISQISQHALRERGKLKRESISSHNENSITETDRLLLQKDEEVNILYRIRGLQSR